jgi:hypothetical protein
MKNPWEFLRCGDGEGWRKSGGPIVWETKKYFVYSQREMEGRKDRRNYISEGKKRKKM